MLLNRKPTGRAMSIPGGLAVAAGVSVSVTIAACLILTKLVVEEKLPMEHVGYGSMILLLTASFLGAVAAQGKIKHRKMLVCLLSGLVYYGILLGFTALFFGGQYTGIGVTGFLILGGCGTAALVTAGQGTSRKNRHKVRIPRMDKK